MNLITLSEQALAYNLIQQLGIMAKAYFKDHMLDPVAM